MHCKHCGNQIENDSKFCSFCGGKVEPIGLQETLIQQEPKQEIKYVQKEVTSSTSQDNNGYLIGGLVFFGVQLFWILWTKLVDNWYDYDYVGKVVNLIFMGIPILFSIYTRKKEHKVILLIAGLLLVFWSIYQNFIA